MDLSSRVAAVAWRTVRSTPLEVPKARERSDHWHVYTSFGPRNIGSLKDRRHHLFDAPLNIPVIRQRPYDRHLARPPRRYPFVDQSPGVDQQTRAHPLREPVLLQMAHLFAELREIRRNALGHLALVPDDPCLQFARRVPKFHRHKALAGAVLQVLKRTLVSRVVRDHEQEAFLRLDDLPQLLDRQDAPVVSERVNQYGCVLARLDDLVEIADRTRLHSTGDRAVDPARRVPLQQIPADQVRSRKVLMTGDGYHRPALQVAVAGCGYIPDDCYRTAQLVRHVLDEARLAAAGRPL